MNRISEAIFINFRVREVEGSQRLFGSLNKNETRKFKILLFFVLKKNSVLSMYLFDFIKCHGIISVFLVCVSIDSTFPSVKV